MESQGEALKEWLRSVGMPEHLWPRLFQKLRGDIFDAGSGFGLVQRALPSTNEEDEEQNGEETAERVDSGDAVQPHPSSFSGANPSLTGVMSSPKASNGSDEDEEETGAGGDITADGAMMSVSASAGRQLGDSGERNAEEEVRGGDEEPVRVAPGYALVSIRDIAAYEDVWLVDHCFTFPLEEDVRPALESNPALLSRLEAILRLSPYTEDPSINANDEAENEENPQGPPPANWEHVASTAAPNVDTATQGQLTSTYAGKGSLLRNAAQRVYESMWPHVGFYHLRQHAVAATATERNASGDHDSSDAGGSAPVHGRSHYSYQHSDDDSDERDESTAARGVSRDEVVKVTCCLFFNDEVGSAVSFSTNDAEANTKLMAIPIYFADKGCVLSVMWNTKDMPAGTEAKRRPAHRWEGVAGVEVTDVLYGRNGPTFEDSLRTCVSCWRNKLALHQSNRATVFGMMTPPHVNHTEGAGEAALAKAACAAQALLAAHGPISMYTDNQGFYRLAARFPPLSSLLQRASLPRDAHLLWRLHHTPASFRELGAHARYVFWLPGEHRFLDYPNLIRLLHTKVGSQPWCPLMYDGVNQLKEFVGDYLVRELAINWELGALDRSAEAARLPHQAAANVHYDVFGEYKRLLRQQDGTNLWLVRRAKEFRRSRSQAEHGVTASPSLGVFSGEEGAGSAENVGGNHANRGSLAEAGAVLFRGGAATHKVGREGGGAGEVGDDEASEPSSSDGAGTDGPFQHALMVTDNLDAVLQLAGVYRTTIHKVCVSPFLGSRQLYARAKAAAAGEPASGKEDIPFFFSRHGDCAPLFQFLVCVKYSPGGTAQQQREGEENQPAVAAAAGDSAHSSGGLAVFVHHLVSVKWVEYTTHGVKVRRRLQGSDGGELANWCLYGPLQAHVPATAEADTAKTAGLRTLPAHVRSWLDRRDETRALSAVSEQPADGDPANTLHRCTTLLQELFYAIHQDYAQVVTPALLAATVDRGDGGGAEISRRDAYYGVYGVDVSLSFSPMMGPTAPGQGPRAEAQPILSSITRDPDLGTATAVHPGVCGDLLSTLLLGCPINTTQVL